MFIIFARAKSVINELLKEKDAFKWQLKSWNLSSLAQVSKRQTFVFVLWVATGPRDCFHSDTCPQNKKGWAALM